MAFGASVGKILLVGNYRSTKAWLRLQTEFAGIVARLGAAGMQLQVAQRTFLEKKAQFEEKSIADDKKHNEAFEGLMASQTKAEAKAKDSGNSFRESGLTNETSRSIT